MDFSLERTELDEDWDWFVSVSPNGTIFSSKIYLESLEHTIAVYYCYKKKEIKAAVALLETQDGKSAVLHEFVIYNGIMFAPKANRQNRAQIHSEQFRIASYIAQELTSLYEGLELSLHPSIVDIRPFLWVNYGTGLPMYQPDIRYTSHVDISDFAGANDLADIKLFKDFSSSRRQEVRYAIKKGVYTEEKFDPDLFVEFYCRTMDRQRISVPQIKKREMKHLMSNLHDRDMGKMFVSCTSDGTAGSMAFFCYDNKRAYYLFGANNPDLRNAHTGTAVLWDAFTVLSRNGRSEVDLEGVNSPHRGWFKLSFGGDLVPYYELQFNTDTGA